MLFVTVVNPMAFVARTVVGVHEEPEPTQYLSWTMSPVPVVVPTALSVVPCVIELPAVNVNVTVGAVARDVEGMTPLGGELLTLAHWIV